jgi:flagellar secretion chaperone FliS
MTYNQQIKNYQKTNVETADNLKLVIMCYDVAIRDLEDAKKLHESRSMDAAYQKIHHAQNIITELLIALDYERGGEIAQNLSRLYNFVVRQLVGINSRQDTAMYDHLIHILSELKSAWEQVRQAAHHAGASELPTPTQSWAVSA